MRNVTKKLIENTKDLKGQHRSAKSISLCGNGGHVFKVGCLEMAHGDKTRGRMMVFSLKGYLGYIQIQKLETLLFPNCMTLNKSFIVIYSQLPHLQVGNFSISHMILQSNKHYKARLPSDLQNMRVYVSWSWFLFPSVSYHYSEFKI